MIVESDRHKCIHLAISEAQAGDTILIAGKGHEDYQIIGREKIHFDDREEAQAALTLRTLGKNTQGGSVRMQKEVYSEPR
jgi:UDP-N-acetylmuramoyl-L-alanyl-D-glutamate--2,6-diaminopimelate ligase